MSDINEKIKAITKDWDIDSMVQAIIADDPEMQIHADDLRQTLIQTKLGNARHWKTTQIQVSPIAETRHKANLSQSKFADKLGISVATLRSWEQGLRMPSGAAKTLLDLLSRKPELIHELQA